jgi:hypothetical protein
MSETKDPYVYRIKSITKVVDGDTIDADIDLVLISPLLSEFVLLVSIPQRAARGILKKKRWVLSLKNGSRKLLKALRIF